MDAGDDETKLRDTLRTRAATGMSRDTTAVWKLTAFLVGALGGGRPARLVEGGGAAYDLGRRMARRPVGTSGGDGVEHRHQA